MKYTAVKYLLLAGTLAGCTLEEDLPPEVVISHVNAGALSTAYVADWSIFEAAATALRNSPKYQIQSFDWHFTNPVSPTYSSFSLAHGRVEYAHAAGLTGAGQTISIVDAGFLTSHVELAGKTINTPAGYTPDIDSHGTTVAAVAAGLSSAGDSIGVAPGANLLLGDFLSNDGFNNLLVDSVIAANQQASTFGAIVQNNSWGSEAPATYGSFQAEYGSVFSAYYQSVLNLSQSAVIVFAVSNDESRTTIDLHAGLPVVAPELQNSWIAVVNAIPIFNGSNISSATIISSKCFEAAAWCMAADGTVWGAQATGNSDYALGTGTSFAAPQISGGIALLAEAFPTLSHEELRARMLASADNSFYNHTGYVEFAAGVQHGFNTEFGHGFMNMKAALSPIGGSYLPRANGSSDPLGTPTIASTGMAGNVISRSLAQHDLLTIDGMGAGFDVSANLLSADVVHRYDPLASIQNLFSVDLDSDSFDPLRSETVFASFENGHQVEFETDGPAVSLLLPTAEAGSFGVSLSQSMDLGAGSFEIGLSAVQENGGFAGIKSLLDDDSLSAVHGSVQMAYNMPLGRDQMLLLNGSFGVAAPNGNLTDMDMTAAGYNSFGVSYNAGNVLGTGDRLSVGLALPNAIQSGTVNVAMPVARSGGEVDFTTLSVPLAASARQLDISASYGLPLFDGSDIVFSAVRSLNDGNIAGKNTTEAGFGFRFSF